MGSYSTLTITRRAAKQAITLFLDEATDEELSDALFGLLADRTFHNFTVVPEDADPEIRDGNQLVRVHFTSDLT